LALIHARVPTDPCAQTRDGSVEGRARSPAHRERLLGRTRHADPARTSRRRTHPSTAEGSFGRAIVVDPCQSALIEGRVERSRTRWIPWYAARPSPARAPRLTNATASHMWLDRAESRARTVRTRPLVPRIALAASLGFLAGERDRAGDAARDARRAPGSRARCSPNSRRAIETASRCRREAHARARRESGSRRRLIARRPRAFPSRRTTRPTTKTRGVCESHTCLECDRNAKNPGFLP